MIQRYIFKYGVYITSNPEIREESFSIDDKDIATCDEGATKHVGHLIADIRAELPFAPPRVCGTLYRLEQIGYWDTAEVKRT